MEKDLIKLYNERYSCRNFNGKKIDKNIIYDIIDKARLAPSACNSQPWRVLITCDEKENALIRQATQVDGKNKFLDKASAFIVILETEAVLKPGMERLISNDKFVKYDIGEFVAYLTLYAQSKNISNIIIGWLDDKILKDNFNLEGYSCSLVVALGYSDEGQIPTKKRKVLQDIII